LNVYEVGIVKTKLFLGSLTLLFAASAQAATVQQFKNFSVPQGVTATGIFAFQPFDTTLGTLDEVRFDLQGVVDLSASATPNLIPMPPAGDLQPVPYNYSLKMDMDLFSLAGFDFEFNSDAQFLFQGAAAGIETTLNQQRSFSLSAEFDDISDLIGFDIPTTSGIAIPPTGISSSRGDFEENLITSSTGLQFLMLNTWSVVFDTGQVAQIVPMGSSNGLVTLSYEYTQFPDPPIPEVPVPAAIWLFGTGLVGLVGFNRRRNSA
jgi:hypothetical protein